MESRLEVDRRLAADLASGTYTPTATGVSNIDSITADVFEWMRIGNIVLASGSVAVNPTAAATASRYRLSLPVASNFTAATQAHGVVTVFSLLEVGGVSSNGASNEAEVDFLAQTAAVHGQFVSFTYQIV
jgi:hypothetical protein